MRGVLVLCRDVGDPCRDHGTVRWLNVVRLKSASGEQHVCIHDKCFTWERSLLNGQRALDMAMIEQRCGDDQAGDVLGKQVGSDVAKVPRPLPRDDRRNQPERGTQTAIGKWRARRG